MEDNYWITPSVGSREEEEEVLLSFLG